MDYIPNEVDVLMARTKTTGISETKFKSGQLSIQFSHLPLQIRILPQPLTRVPPPFFFVLLDAVI